MKYIIGLGNPGLEYSSTKHNIGYAVVKELARDNKIRIAEKRYSALIGRGRISGEDVVLVLPHTYMNRSGDTVGDLVRDEMEKGDDLIIVCDDINLKLGRIRMRKEGSAGGHKGLRSIIESLGRSDFARIRIGIATRLHKGDITGYVLTPFGRKERRNVSHAVTLASEAISCWAAQGMDKAMNKFNIRKAATS